MSDLFELLDAAAGPEPVATSVADDLARGRRALARRRVAVVSSVLAAVTVAGVVALGGGAAGRDVPAQPGGTTVSASAMSDRIAVPPLAPAPAYARSPLLTVHPGLAPRGWAVAGDAKITDVGPVDPDREALGYSRISVTLSGHRLTADELARLRADGEPLRVGSHDGWLVREGDDRVFWVDLGAGLQLCASVPAQIAMSEDDVVRMLAATTVDADRVPARS